MSDTTEDSARARALVGFLERPDYTPLTQRDLLHRMHVPQGERPAVRVTIRRLTREGRIHKISGGRLVAAPPSEELRGVLQLHREGYGFVVPDEGGEDVFVGPRRIGEAMGGDHVVVRITGRRRDGRLHGVVTEILESRGREVLGLFVRRGRGGVVEPFDPKVASTIHIPTDKRLGATDLQAVRVSLTTTPRRGTAEGQVIELLGHLDDPGTDVLIVTRKYGLATEFPEDVLREAAALPAAVGAEDAGRRERFDDPAPVTIDGETAQDFDDAVAVTELPGGGFRLFVHIADVGQFVRAGSPLDLEARRRGTSVYFPNRVLPMLPEKLSNDLCSLRPGEDRLVQSAVIDFSAKGEVGAVRFADGVIRSAARLTYTQVAAVLERQGKTGGVAKPIASMLHVADRLRELLERRRRADGGIDFDLPEPQILLDVEGAMTGVTITPRNRAHRMIEAFMIAANEAVAAHLCETETGGIFRIHEAPDPAKLDALAKFVARFGVRLDTRGASVASKQIRGMLDRAEGRPEYRVITQVTLRSMQQARYSPENIGHFALASTDYCHFTSPIRRYPDLIVHRQLRARRQRRRPAHDAGALRAISETSSELERNAESAERELLVWKKVAFIADRVGESFEGLVTGVTSFGLFVQLIENLVEGLVRVERLGAEWFEFDDTRFELLGSSTGKAFRLGDRIEVRVLHVDRVLQRVDFVPVDAPAGETGEAPAARGRRGAGRRRTRR